MAKVSMRWSLNFDGFTHALTYFLHEIQSTGLKNQQNNKAKKSKVVLINSRWKLFKFQIYRFKLELKMEDFD